MQNKQSTWTPMVLGQLLAVLAVLIAGVVSITVVKDSDEDDVLKTVAATQASVSAQQTFRSTFAVEVDGGPLHITSTGEVFIDNVNHAQSGHVQAPGLGSIELRQIDDIAYIHLPPGKEAQGKQWIALPASNAGAVSGQNPLDSLRVLAGAEDVQEVGQEDVNGISTTHYSLVVDHQALVDAIGRSPSAANLPPGVLDRIQDVKTDLWVDDENLARRLRIEAKVQSVSVRTSFEFHDFGKPVNVTAPPADQVLHLTSPQQLGQLLQGTG